MSIIFLHHHYSCYFNSSMLCLLFGRIGPSIGSYCTKLLAENVQRSSHLEGGGRTDILVRLCHGLLILPYDCSVLLTFSQPFTFPFSYRLFYCQLFTWLNYLELAVMFNGVYWLTPLGVLISLWSVLQSKSLISLKKLTAKSFSLLRPL